MLSVVSKYTNMKKLKIATLLLGLVFAPFVNGSAATAETMETAAAASVVGARDIVTEIIDVVGLKPRFELRAANIENAAAVIYNGKRYILYNERFLAAVNNAVRTDWAGVSILAHEIGHHLNGHTLSRAGSNPGDELEADEFSGFVLRKMGASLDEAQAAMRVLSEERTSATHPGRSYRLAAISRGWRNAEEQILASNNVQPHEQPRTPTPRPDRAAIAQAAEEPSGSSLDKQYVFRKVNFAQAPQEQFYLTNRLNLVHVTDDGIKVIGKLTRTTNRSFPYLVESDYLKTIFLTVNGTLVNQKGQKVGYLSQIST